MFLALCLGLLLKGASSTASGYDTWTCRPSQHNTPYSVTGTGATGATGPFFAIRLLGANNTETTMYTPGIAQTVELYSAVAGAKIAGVTAGVFTGNLTNCPSSCTSIASALTSPTGVNYLRAMSGCTGGMTQTSRQNSVSFKFGWTASSNQTGSVTVWTVVVGAGDTYEAVSARFSPWYVASASPVSTSTRISVVPSVNMSVTPPLPSFTAPAQPSLTVPPQPSPPVPSIHSSTAPARPSVPYPTQAQPQPSLTQAQPQPSPTRSQAQPSLTQPPPSVSIVPSFSPSRSPAFVYQAVPNESDATQQMTSLSIAAVIIAAVVGFLGVLFVMQTLYYRKKRRAPLNMMKNDDVVIMQMPKPIYEV